MHIKLITAIHPGKENGKWDVAKRDFNIICNIWIINRIYTRYLNKLLKLLNSEAKFKYRSSRERLNYLLNNKKNLLPRIPESIGDYFCKQDERKHPLILCSLSKEKNNNKSQLHRCSPTCWLRRQSNTSSLWISGLSTSLPQCERKMMSENSLNIEHTIAGYRKPTLIHSQRHYLTPAAYQKNQETCLVRQPFKKTIFHIVFETSK